MKLQGQQMPFEVDTSLQKLILNSQEGISLLNKSFEVIYRSPASQRITGRPEADIVKIFLKDQIHPVDQEYSEEILQYILLHPDYSKTCTFQLKTNQGGYIWLDCTFTNLLEDPGVNAIVCNFTDITEARKNARTLEKINRELDAYKQLLDLSTLVIITDGKGIISAANANYCTISRYGSHEILGEDYKTILMPFQNKALMPELLQTISSGQIWKGELKNKAKDGSFYWVDATIVPLLDEFSHKPYQYITTCTDISERKRDEFKVRQDENQLRLLEYVMTHTNDAILITEAEPLDLPGPRISYVNEAFTRITGYTSDEVLGKSPRILQGPKTNKDELKRLSKALHNWETCEVTILNYKKNGEEFLINFTVTPIADENGWFTHWVSINRDITERRKQELEYNAILDHAPDIICTVGTDGYLKKVNPAMTAILGYSEQELLAMPIDEIVFPGDPVRIMAQMNIENKERKTSYFENRCLTSTGQIRWFAWTSTQATEEGLIYTVAKDITDKKELEDMLSKVTRLAVVGGWVFDVINHTTFWSDVTREIFEAGQDYKPDMASDIHFFKDVDDKTLITGHINLAIETGKSFDTELQFVTANQNLKWIRMIGQPEFDGTKCVRIRGSYQDIDTRKNAEITAIGALVEKNTILESIGDAFFAVDNQWTVTYWNNMAEKVLHKTKQQMLGCNLWSEFSGDIKSELYSNFQQAAVQNQAVHFDYYYQIQEKWFDISAYPSDNGLSVYAVDVTERKKNIAAMEESERNYSALFHLSPLPMWVFDSETLVFLDINDAAVKNYGYSRSEFLTMTIKDIMWKEDILQSAEILRHTIVSEQKMTGNGKYRHITKNGNIIQVDIQSNLISYRGKFATIVLANDMTARYNYINFIEEKNTKLREIAWMQSHLVRAPLARIMSLVPMIKDPGSFDEERDTILDFLGIAANELDEVIRGISNKTDEVNSPV